MPAPSRPDIVHLPGFALRRIGYLKVKMKHIRSFLLLAALLLGAASAGADAITYTQGGRALFVFDIPEGWRVTKGIDISPEQMPEGLPPSPRVYSLRPPDEPGLMWTGLWVPANARNAKEFAALVRSLRLKMLENVRVTYRDERVVNGRKVNLVAGQGRRNGLEMDIVFAAVQLAPDRLAVVTFIGEPRVFDRWEADLSDMLATVRPAKGATP
jgi:hypothetical protein